jgi:uncharacterized membrane protein YozB (DUF420 family)
MNMDFSVEELPAVNASLNALAAVLLVLGWAQIKLGRERAHKILMLTAFAVSIIFLTCYLIYHYHKLSVPFQGPSSVRPIYYTILISHVILAATVPFLASITIYLGLSDRRARHRQFARWTFPIWLYVSITGVAIYVMLYQLFPGPEQASIINRASGTTLTEMATDISLSPGGRGPW